MVKTQVITSDSNHASVQNLRGWNVQGTVVLRLRKGGLVTGDPIAIVNNTDSFMSVDAIDAVDGLLRTSGVHGELRMKHPGGHGSLS